MPTSARARAAFLRREVDHHPERGQQVRGARAARHRAVAVFRHPAAPAAAATRSGAGRNVEAAPCRRRRCRKCRPGRPFHAGMCSTRRRIAGGRRPAISERRFAFHGERHQEGRLQGVRKLAVHQPAEQLLGRRPVQGRPARISLSASCGCHETSLSQPRSARTRSSSWRNAAKPEARRGLVVLDEVREAINGRLVLEVVQPAAGRATGFAQRRFKRFPGIFQPFDLPHRRQTHLRRARRIVGGAPNCRLAQTGISPARRLE